MQLGEFKLTTISGGKFRSDGGTMFGVVPKTLWSRFIEPDEKNLIAQATNCLLIQVDGKNLLMDTGYGGKLTEKQRAIFAAEEGDPLLASLAQHDLSPEMIDAVILTHLHFDHAGGATTFDNDGKIVPTFPNAEYIVQRAEWVTATAEFPELLNAYPLDNLLPLKESGQLRLFDGDVEVFKNIRATVTGGHTTAHTMFTIGNGKDTAVYLADICPTTRHLPALWGMSFDVDQLRVRQIKPQILGEIADNGWWALFDHDPNHAAAKLARDKRRDFIVTETIDSL